MESHEEGKTLTKYTERGNMIHDDSNYDNTPIGHLEIIILEHIESLKIMKEGLRNDTQPSGDANRPLPMNAIRGYLGSNSIRRDDDSLERIFYAIVAPSMEGKTQSAFAFRRIRPLYFLLFKQSLSATEKIQDIYRNFANLSDKFKQFAVLDFNMIMKKNADPFVSKSIYDQVSADVLIKNYGDVPFLLLGFLISLIEHAKTEFDPTQMNWMEFFVKTSRKFPVHAMSINQVRKLDIGNHALFFDEFEALKWTVFVRNLARAAWIPLLVANTNTNAANLVGKNQSAFSRIDRDFAWSLVSIRLNYLGKNSLKNMEEQISVKTEQLVVQTEGSEAKLITEFFEDFKNNQLKHLRPGFAQSIFSHIIAIPVGSSPGTLNDILRGIVKPFVSELIDKKILMNSNPLAILGTFALFMNNAYLSEDNSELTHICHRKTYLQDHFYYLVNPVDNTKWCFLTYPPLAKPQSSEVIAEQNPVSIELEDSLIESVQKISLADRPLRVVRNPNGSDSTCSDWSIEYTYFKAEEIIPMFALLSVVNNEKSITTFFKEGMAKIKSNALGTGDTQNMSQNVPFNGNELEVLATVCLVESSHHNIGELYSTFSGQDGKSFLTNLVGNLVVDGGCRRTDKVVIDFHTRTIGTLLNHIHIPYLFPSGMHLPEFFKAKLSDPAGFNSRSVNFGRLRRTINGSQIDIIFDYFITKKTKRSPTVASCAVECKNWADNLPLSNLRSIIEKAVRNTANLSLVFCNSVAGAKDETFDTFKKECTKKRWNVLKLKKVDQKEIGKKIFKLDRYFPLLSFRFDPALTCIVLELSIINS